MLRLLVLVLFPLLALCDRFMRDDCWCRNSTHLAYQRHLQLEASNVPQTGPSVITEWCIEATKDGRGKCSDQHTKQYNICASHRAFTHLSRSNEFCYSNHGNHRGFKPATYFSKGPDKIFYNNVARRIPFKKPALPMTTEENTKYCEPICRDFRGWNLPTMPPWKPSKHGVVECRHQVFDDIEPFPFEDGVPGTWPANGTLRGYPGGISTTGAGVIDYWEIKPVSQDTHHWCAIEPGSHMWQKC